MKTANKTTTTTTTKKRTGYRMFRLLTEQRRTLLNEFIADMDRGCLLIDPSGLRLLQSDPLSYGLTKQGVEVIARRYNCGNGASTVSMMHWFRKLLGREIARQAAKAAKAAKMVKA